MSPPTGSVLSLVSPVSGWATTPRGRSRRLTVPAPAPALSPVKDAPTYDSPYGEDYLHVSTVEGDAGRLAWIDADHGTALVPAHNRPVAAAALPGETAIVAPDYAATLATIRRAISDPGHWVKREREHDGGYESVPSWGPRAVVVALRQLSSGRADARPA